MAQLSPSLLSYCIFLGDNFFVWISAQTSTKFVHSCVSYAKLYNLKHIFHSYFRFNQHILKNILKMSIKIVHTFILYFQINLAMNLTFCFYSYFKIQSVHYVKLYISCLCIQNVVFDFCVLLQIMFSNIWVFIFGFNYEHHYQSKVIHSHT